MNRDTVHSEEDCFKDYSSFLASKLLQMSHGSSGKNRNQDDFRAARECEDGTGSTANGGEIQGTVNLTGEMRHIRLDIGARFVRRTMILGKY